MTVGYKRAEWKQYCQRDSCRRQIQKGEPLYYCVDCEENFCRIKECGEEHRLRECPYGPTPSIDE